MIGDRSRESETAIISVFFSVSSVSAGFFVVVFSMNCGMGLVFGSIVSDVAQLIPSMEKLVSIINFFDMGHILMTSDTERSRLNLDICNR